MKTLSLFSMLLLSFLCVKVYAQPCIGTTSALPRPMTGLTYVTPSDSIPCFTKGVSQSQVMYFEIGDTMRISGQLVTIQTFKIDSIENLPQGLCWKLSSGNQLTPLTDGARAIEFFGNPTGLSGQYKLKIKVTMLTDIVMLTKIDFEVVSGKKIILRLIQPGNACPPVDTANAGSNFSPFYDFNCATPPTLNIVKDTLSPFCVKLTAQSNATTFKWSDGVDASSINVCDNGVYAVTVVDNNFCANRDSVQWTTSGLCSDTICGYVYNDQNQNGVFDAGESPYVNIAVQLDSMLNMQTFTDASGYYKFIVPCGQAVTVAPNISSLSSPYLYTQVSPSAVYTYQGVLPEKKCGFNFGIYYNGATISGKTYLDVNNNNVLDTSDFVIPFQTIRVGTYDCYSNQQGEYSIIVPTGSYVLDPLPNIYFSNAVPSPLTSSVVATTPGNNYSGNNFAFHVPPGVNLLGRIDAGVVRPGFNSGANLNYVNKGTVATAATVTYHYDNNLVFVSSIPAPVSHNVATRELMYNVGNLLPGDNGFVAVVLHAPTSLPLGTIVKSNMTITAIGGTDIDLSDNNDTLVQTVVGSFDPNDKLVKAHFANPTLNTVDVLPNTTIEYKINFQNTGTYEALNVIVTDTLDTDFDAGSFRLLETSHACKVSRVGRNLSFNFSNIHLADSFHNEPASHGFIRYAIKPSTSSIGTVLENTAFIYFDFNAAVVTNTTHNEINRSVLAINEIGTNDVHVYPNPSTDIICISAKSTSDIKFDTKLSDMSGKVVVLDNNVSLPHYMSVQSLAAGVYMLSIQNATTSLVQKVIVK